MSFVAVSVGVGVAGLGLNVAKSISQSSKASEIERNNKRPDYVIPAEYEQNLKLAKQMALIGMPQQQYNNQLNNIQQNQAGAIGALSRSANPGAGLASIVRGGDNATNQLNAQDAMMRQDNQRYMIGQNAQLAQQKLAKQQYDKFDKYTENFNQAAALRGAANQNLQNGITGAAQMATNLYAINEGGGFSSGNNKASNEPPTWGQPTPPIWGVGPYNPAAGWGYMGKY